MSYSIVTGEANRRRQWGRFYYAAQNNNHGQSKIIYLF
jgi:hypothetical protein